MEFQLQHLLLAFSLMSLYPDGTLQCNCVLDKCAADGSCEKGYTCKSGYFGDFCKFFDALDREKFKEAQLRDEDYSTCVAINGELRVTYNSMKIYMVRLIGSFGNLLSTFTFAFKDKGDEFACDGSLVKLNNNSLEYYCKRMNFSQELIIGNIDGKSICHVAATEGGNKERFQRMRRGLTNEKRASIKDCSPYCAKGESCDSSSGLCKSGCSPGFFGEQCTHLGLPSKMTGTETMTCHCTGGKCNNPTDKCQDFENCIAGWFGYNCAYKDLIVLGTTSDEVLNDNKKDTCQKDTDSLASVVWDKPILFSFVTLTFKEDVDLGSFMLMGKTGDALNTYLEEDTKIKMIKNHVFQISLASRVEMNELTVSWTGTASLCSMSVSGDRNLAFEFATSPEIAENPALKDIVGALTDGNIAGENCLNRKLKNTLRFRLPHSILISRVNIYPALYNKDKASFNLTRRSTDSSSSQLMAINGNKYSTVFLPSKEMFNAIEFQQIIGDIDICEIEIFGECVSPYYGFACRDRCRESCTRQECDYTGQCMDTGLAKRAKSQSPPTKASSYAIVSLIVIMAMM